MYVRDAKNREEVWLLDWIEEFGLDDVAFRSRDYVVAVDETTGQKAGFGRIRIHNTDAGEFCELTSIGVLPEWQSQGVGAHVVERLLDVASDARFDRVYTFTACPEYFSQFGFSPISTDELPEPLVARLESVRESNTDTIAMTLLIDEFTMPNRLRERFKQASPQDRSQPDHDSTETSSEDFGIDDEETSYKYDI